LAESEASIGRSRSSKVDFGTNRMRVYATKLISIRPSHSIVAFIVIHNLALYDIALFLTYCNEVTRALEVCSPIKTHIYKAYHSLYGPQHSSTDYRREYDILIGRRMGMEPWQKGLSQ